MPLEPSDNDFDIWPGQSHEVVIETADELENLDLQIESVNRFKCKA